MLGKSSKVFGNKNRGHLTTYFNVKALIKLVPGFEWHNWLHQRLLVQGRIQEFLIGGPNFGSERTVCEHWSPLAQEILCEQRRANRRRVPKKN